MARDRTGIGIGIGTGSGQDRDRGPARHVLQRLHLRGPVRERAVLPVLPAGAELAGHAGGAAGGHRHRPLLHRHPALGVSAGKGGKRACGTGGRGPVSPGGHGWRVLSITPKPAVTGNAAPRHAVHPIPTSPGRGKPRRDGKERGCPVRGKSKLQFHPSIGMAQAQRPREAPPAPLRSED